MKSISKDNKSVLYLLLIAIFLQLLLLFYFKYHNQNLALINFNPEVRGNFFNLLIYFIAILFLGLTIFNRKSKINLKLLTTLLVLSYLFLIAGFISIQIKLPLDSIYIFGQFGNKLFTGLCYSLYQLSLFIFLFTLIFELGNKKQRVLIKSVLMAILTMVLLLSYSFIFIESHQEKLKLSPLDSKSEYNLLVFGAAVWSDNKPSPILASRIDKAIELIKKYKIRKIFLTGGNAPGELSEAEVALDYIKSKNISVNNVIIEKKTTSTTEQIQYIKKKLNEEEQKNLIVISDAFHLVRIKEISKFHKLRIKTIASELELNFLSNLYNKTREALALTLFWFFAL